MADINAIREGLAESLKTITAIKVVEGYELTSPTPPCAHIVPADTSYHEAMQDGDELYVLIVQVFVSTGIAVASQKMLGRFMASKGTESVKAALEANQEPGGGAYDVTVMRNSGQQKLITNSGAVILYSDWYVNVRCAPET